MATLLGTDSPHSGGKRRNCCGNIVAKFAGSKITGQGFSRGTQVRGTSRQGLVFGVRALVVKETGDLRSESCLKRQTLPGRGSVGDAAFLVGLDSAADCDITGGCCTRGRLCR